MAKAFLCGIKKAVAVMSNEQRREDWNNSMLCLFVSFGRVKKAGRVWVCLCVDDYDSSRSL